MYLESNTIRLDVVLKFLKWDGPNYGGGRRLSNSGEQAMGRSLSSLLNGLVTELQNVLGKCSCMPKRELCPFQLNNPWLEHQITVQNTQKVHLFSNLDLHVLVHHFWSVFWVHHFWTWDPCPKIMVQNTHIQKRHTWVQKSCDPSTQRAVPQQPLSRVPVSKYPRPKKFGYA